MQNKMIKLDYSFNEISLAAGVANSVANEIRENLKLYHGETQEKIVSGALLTYFMLTARGAGATAMALGVGQEEGVKNSTFYGRLFCRMCEKRLMNETKSLEECLTEAKEELEKEMEYVK